MPVSAEPPFTHGEDIASDESAIRLADANWACMAIPCLGRRRSRCQRPRRRATWGVQLVAARFREDLLFDAAEVIEARNEITTPIDARGLRSRAIAMTSARYECRRRRRCSDGSTT